MTILKKDGGLPQLMNKSKALKQLTMVENFQVSTDKMIGIPQKINDFKVRSEKKNGLIESKIELKKEQKKQSLLNEIGIS